MPVLQPTYRPQRMAMVAGAGRLRMSGFHLLELAYAALRLRRRAHPTAWSPNDSDRRQVVDITRTPTVEVRGGAPAIGNAAVRGYSRSAWPRRLLAVLEVRDHVAHQGFQLLHLGGGEPGDGEAFEVAPDVL